ncbi:MAG TPA: hypothetical protein VFS30_10545 [Dehalococcoidia bacterium]|jgi:hypothetical protein|nr:hypothetical protein [Dehalococcoidia bacterium]
MSRDPIVDEVRAIRDAIAKEHDYDLEAIFKMLQEAEAKSGREHVSPTPPEVSVRAAAPQLRVAPGEAVAALRPRR